LKKAEGSLSFQALDAGLEDFRRFRAISGTKGIGFESKAKLEGGCKFPRAFSSFLKLSF
jgi:hypothetical protein